MKQKNKIKNIQQLYDWINSSKQCLVVDEYDDCFILQAPNDATWHIKFDEDDEIEDVINKTISQLFEFDADEEFTELWCKEFAERNCFTPLQFITMLKEDEETFRNLADQLREFVGY